jgi:hypothetical protein
MDSEHDLPNSSIEINLKMIIFIEIIPAWTEGDRDSIK